jgi:hypothetical protein
MKVIASILILVALVVGIAPQFTDCAAQGRPPLELANGKTVPMKCAWTAQAEIAVAAPLGLTGLMLFLSKRKESRRVLAVLGIALGVFAVLLPTALIGVCASPDMICNSVMKPTLILSGTVAAAASLVALVLSWGKEPQAVAGKASIAA